MIPCFISVLLAKLYTFSVKDDLVSREYQDSYKDYWTHEGYDCTLKKLINILRTDRSCTLLWFHLVDNPDRYVTKRHQFVDAILLHSLFTWNIILTKSRQRLRLYSQHGLKCGSMSDTGSAWEHPHQPKADMQSFTDAFSLLLYSAFSSRREVRVEATWWLRHKLSRELLNCCCPCGISKNPFYSLHVSDTKPPILITQTDVINL